MRKKSFDSAKAAKASNSEFQQWAKSVTRGTGSEHLISSGRNLVTRRQLATGIHPLDLVTLGGLLEGTATMLYGIEGCGKTLLSIKLMIAAQRKYSDKCVAFVDREGTFDREFADMMGVDMDRFQYIDSEYGEQAVDLVVGLMGCSDMSLCVLDSIPALAPSTIIDRSAEDQTMGKLAALCGNMMTRLTSVFARERKRGNYPILAIVNQVRPQFGVMARGGIIPQEKPPGGRQLMFQSATHIRVKKKPGVAKAVAKESKAEGDFDDLDILYNTHPFSVERHKGPMLGKSGEYEIVVSQFDPRGFGYVDGNASLVRTLERFGKVRTSGSWIIGLPGTKMEFKVQGIGEFTKLMVSDPELFRKLYNASIILARESRNISPLPPDGRILGKTIIDIAGAKL